MKNSEATGVSAARGTWPPRRPSTGMVEDTAMNDGEKSLLLMRPRTIFLFVLAVVFVSEVAVMLLLAALSLDLSHGAEGFIDAVLLTVLAGPILYFVLFRPIAASNRALRNSESELRLVNSEVESQVARRTAELDVALARQSAQQERLIRINEGAQLLQACRDLPEIAKVVAAQLSVQFTGVPGAFYVYRASRDALEREASWQAGPDDFATTIAAGNCWATRRGRLHCGGSASGRLHCDSGTCHNAHTVCLPLAAGEEVVGLIILWPAADPEREPMAGVERADWSLLLSAFRESVAVAVANVRLRETLREQSLRDRLTGLLNRRYIDEALNIGLAEALRRGAPYSVAMIDVDHFKRFNDTYGHEAGDLVLSTLGAHFSRSLRQCDIPCRYGGEEFLVLLPATDGDSALAVLQKLCRSVEALVVRLDATRQAGVTISAGVATFPADGGDAETLLRSADGALYQSKHAGRNRVTRAMAQKAVHLVSAREA